MKSFQEFVAQRLEEKTEVTPLDYRMERPAQFDPLMDGEKLFMQLQKPETAKLVMKVLDEHPEMKEKLMDMIARAKDHADHRNPFAAHRLGSLGQAYSKPQDRSDWESIG